MGKLQRASAQERLQAGILTIRIRPKERARDRKAREARQRIFLPVAKGSKPLTALECDEVFGQARRAKEKMEAGVLPRERMELADVDLPAMSDEDARIIVRAMTGEVEAKDPA
jgi:hypothetical protein